MGKQEYLSAGRFAALVGTTKETLFHYDEIGLFVPKRGKRLPVLCDGSDGNVDVIGMLRGAGHAAGRDSKLSGTAKSRKLSTAGTGGEGGEKIQRPPRDATDGGKKRFLAQASAECREAFERSFCPVGDLYPAIAVSCRESQRTADNLAVNQKIGELYAYCGQYGNRSSYNVGFVQKRETLETGNF